MSRAACCSYEMAVICSKIMAYSVGKGQPLTELPVFFFLLTKDDFEMPYKTTSNEDLPRLLPMAIAHR